MSPAYSKYRLPPDSKEITRQFLCLLECLMDSAQGNAAQGKNSSEVNTHFGSPLEYERLVSDLKNQGWGADLETAPEMQNVLELGLANKTPMACLLRTLQPLTFIFRLFCQRHQSLIENWLEGWVTERELAELQQFCVALSGSKMRFGQAKSAGELMTAVEYLASDDFSGTIWCDWKLKGDERALLLKAASIKKIEIVEQPILKPQEPPPKIPGRKILLLTTDKALMEFKLKASAQRAFGDLKSDPVNLDSAHELLNYQDLNTASMVFLDLHELAVVTEKRVQSVNSDLVTKIKSLNPRIQIIALLEVQDNLDENRRVLKNSGVDSAIWKLNSLRGYALLLRTLERSPNPHGLAKTG